MNLGDFEQDVWGIQLCPVECLDFQVSDIRSEKKMNQSVSWVP